MTDNNTQLPRRPGEPPASFAAVQSIRPIANTTETAPPSAPAAPGEPREGRPARFPPASAIRPVGEVVAGRHTVAVASVAGYLPSIGFSIDYPKAKAPFRFFLRGQEARELAELLTKAATEIEAKK